MGSFSAEVAPRSGDSLDTEALSPEQTSMRAVQTWCEAAFEEADADQKSSEELQMVDTYIDYLAGRQWPGGRPSYRAKPVNNLMNRLFWELCSTLTDLRPIVDIRSTVHDKSMVDNEEKVNNACRAWWRNNRIEGKVAQTIVYAILTTGIAKIEWDREIQFGNGDVNIVPMSPRSLLYLKPGPDLQSSQAVIYQDWKPVGWVQRKHPDRAHVVVADQDASQFQTDQGPPANITPHLYQILSPAMKRVLGKNTRSVQPSAYPMCRYREFWLRDYSVNVSNRTVWVGDRSKGYGIAYQVKPMERLYPRGRLIVMAGREVVHDGPNPYWHGLFPFALCRLNVVPWQILGLSDLRSWKDLQDIINQIVAGVLDMIRRAVNPPIMAPRNALSESAWNSLDLSMPGSKVAFSQTAAHEPKVVSVAPLPGFVLQMLQITTHEMKEQSGIAAVSEMIKKKQVPGGDTMDQVRGAQQTPIRLKGRNIEDFIHEIGTQLIPNFFQFYDDERRLRIPGSPGEPAVDASWDKKGWIPGDMQPMDIIRKYQFQIVEGSLLSIQRVEKTLALFRLRLAGEIDRKTFFKKLNQLENVYLDVEEIEKNLKQERSEGLMGMPPKGKKGAQSIATGGKGA